MKTTRNPLYETYPDADYDKLIQIGRREQSKAMREALGHTGHLIGAGLQRIARSARGGRGRS